MASGMDATQSKAVLAGTVGKAAFPTFGGTNSAYLKLCTGTTAGSPTANAGTEITPGGSYTSPGINFAPQTVFNAVTYSGGGTDTSGTASITTNATISQTNMPAATVQQVELWDNTAGTRLRWWWGDLSATVTTNLGDTLSFAAGNITGSLNV